MPSKDGIKHRGEKMKNVYCPYCRKDVDYKVEKRQFNVFRGVEVNTYENVAVCKCCKNDLYVNELEDANIKRISEIYKEKENIITPDEIVGLRRKYAISQRELTGILGFGKMTINRYENGAAPTKSQSEYLKLLIANEKEFLNKVKEAYKKNRITLKTYEKIIDNKDDDKLIKDNIQELYRSLISNTLVRNPDIYNGYKVLNLEVIENIISYIANEVNNLTITSLNKYLWFIDMISFRERDIAITGLTYQKQQYGPTIAEQRYKEISLLDNKYLREDYEDELGTKTRIKSNKNFELDNLRKEEVQIIKRVVEFLKDKSVSEISELTHQENAWKNTQLFDNISFEYAEQLKSL